MKHLVIVHIQHMLTAPSFINLSRMGKPVEQSCPYLIMDAPANAFYSPQGGAVVEGCTCSSEVFLASLFIVLSCVCSFGQELDYFGRSGPRKGGIGP